MDESFSSPSSSRLNDVSSTPTTTRSGLTLVLPSLKNLKASKVAKKTKHPDIYPYSPAIDPEAAPKKGPRPQKLKPLKEVLAKLVSQIKKKDDYAFFLEPVDVTSVPGYSDIIKRPMDLGTMANKVNRGKYRSLEEFANDLKLVTTNAKIFNPPGSIYHTEADRIEVWALDHISKAAATVIQYETDWNIDIEKDDDTSVNIDCEEDDPPQTSIPMEEFGVNGRSSSVVSQIQPTGRRGHRALQTQKRTGTTNTISESIDSEGRLPGSKDGLGSFPPCSDWAKTMTALKLKGKRYKTKKERLRIEKEGPPYLPEGSLDYSELEDPFSVLSALVPATLSRPHLIPVYPPLSVSLNPTQLYSENSTPQPERLPSSHYAPSPFPSTVSVPLNYDPLPAINNEISVATSYSKRRHWQIIRNMTGRKVKDTIDEGEIDEPPWHIPREIHPVDFGSFALLAGALSEELKKRGVTTGIMKEGEEEKAVLNMVRDSIDLEEAQKLPSKTEPDISDTLNDDNHLVNNHFTPQRAAEAEEYIRDVVYGGPEGLAYVRSLAEFVTTRPPEISPNMSPAELSLAHYVQNIVDDITEGRHSLLRETGEEIRIQSSSSTKMDLNSYVASHIATSLYQVPAATAALRALLQIKIQKIDMSALINEPAELFLSEEEWAGKGIREKRRIQRSESVNGKIESRNDGSSDTSMEVEEDGEKSWMEVDASVPSGKDQSSTFEMERPEELAEVLDYVADLIVQINKLVQAGSNSTTSINGQRTDEQQINDTTTADQTVNEDPKLRKLRLNLLALAKRAPLDTLERLPMELVPEHIRHYIPTLEPTDTATTNSIGSATTSGS